MTYKFKNEYRPGDWPVDCAICGSRVWFSDTTVLDPYSGRGNMRACPDDVDPIDYGLVSYSARPEQPVPYAVVLEPNTPANISFASVIGYEILDPMSGITGLTTWDQLNSQTWDTWSTKWGS